MLALSFRNQAPQTCEDTLIKTKIIMICISQEILFSSRTAQSYKKERPTYLSSSSTGPFQIIYISFSSILFQNLVLSLVVSQIKSFTCHELDGREYDYVRHKKYVHLCLVIWKCVSCRTPFFLLICSSKCLVIFHTFHMHIEGVSSHGSGTKEKKVNVKRNLQVDVEKFVRVLVLSLFCVL